MVLRTLNEALIAYTVGCSLAELSPYPLTFYDSKATNVLRFIDSHTVHLLKCAVWFSLAYLQCCLTIVTTVSYRHKMPVPIGSRCLVPSALLVAGSLGNHRSTFLFQ